MADTFAAAQLVDEVLLQGSEELLATTRARIRHEPQSASEFRHSTVDLFLQL